mmetsp:Transcript_5440/g.10838  ORF Transcript_5440/g.10838 Transcript_5440/m.10838 type:complete len:349 (+) Transcript_5440:175-1221(+)
MVASSRSRMETFVGLVILSVVLLLREVQLPGQGSRLPRSTTNSWLSNGGASEKCEQQKRLSKLDRTDCAVRVDQSVCRVASIDDWAIPYQCAGPQYDALEAALRVFRANVEEEHGETWGRRLYGLPAHSRVLFFGNAHTRQMATSLACQQHEQVTRIQLLDTETETTRIDFSNNSTLVMFSDARVLLSDDWMDYLATAGSLEDFDAIILGLFNDCQAELKSQAFECESMTDIMVREIADVYTTGPMLFVSEMSATRSDESTTVRDLIRYYRDTLNRRNMWFINGRRYISQVKLEGAAVNETEEDTEQQDALNEGTLARSLPRCQGEYGGHVDLLAWDVTEFLYNQLVK